MDRREFLASSMGLLATPLLGSFKTPRARTTLDMQLEWHSYRPDRPCRSLHLPEEEETLAYDQHDDAFSIYRHWVWPASPLPPEGREIEDLNLTLYRRSRYNSPPEGKIYQFEYQPVDNMCLPRFLNARRVYIPLNRKDVTARTRCRSIIVKGQYPWAFDYLNVVIDGEVRNQFTCGTLKLVPPPGEVMVKMESFGGIEEGRLMLKRGLGE